MRPVKPPEPRVEALHELRTVVGEHLFQPIREQLAHDVEKLFRGERVVARCAPRQEKARVGVGERDDVPAAAVAKAFDGVERPAMSGVGRMKSLRFSCLFRLVSWVSRLGEGARGVTHFIRGIGDDPADRLRRGTGQRVGLAKRCEKQERFFLADLGMGHPRTADFRDDGEGPTALSFLTGRFGSPVERADLPVPLFQPLFPRIEGVAFDLKGLDGCRKPMLGPTPKHPDFVLCFFGHPDPASCITCRPSKAPNPIPKPTNLHAPPILQRVQYVTGLMQWQCLDDPIRSVGISVQPICKTECSSLRGWSIQTAAKRGHHLSPHQLPYRQPPALPCSLPG